MQITEKATSVLQSKTLVEKLIHAFRYRKAKGWRKAELGLLGKTNKDPTFTFALCANYRKLQSYLSVLHDNKIKGKLQFWYQLLK